MRHARRPQLEDRDDEVDRRRRARDAVEDQPPAVEVDVVARIELLGRERHVVKPTRVRRVALGERDIHEDPRGQIDPVGERVHAREGHVPRPDHQRNQIIAERARGHRDHEQEDHRDPVHREHLVVGLGGQQVSVRADQLGANQQRLDAAGAEERQRGEEVEDPDPLVISRRQPADQSPALGPDPVQALHVPLPVRGDGRRHLLQGLQVRDQR